MKFVDERKTKITAIIIILIIITTSILLIIYKKAEPKIEINKMILNNENYTIELENISKLNLWKKTINKIKENNQTIQIKYNTYKIILNNEKINKKNNLEINVQKNNNYEEWNYNEVVEIDLSKVLPNNCIDQIEIENSKLLADLKKVDIYGINRDSQKSEFVATKNLEEGNVIIEPHEEFNKYILVYVPISEINIKKTKINLYQNESYKLQFKVQPENATNKIINLEYDEQLIKVNEDGSIVGLKEGETQITLQAEENKIIRKIDINIKIKTEGIAVISDEIELIEGEIKSLQAKLLPETISEKTLKYKSENEEIVQVDETGNVSALKNGETKIIITSIAKPIQTREILVKVNKKENNTTSNIASSESNIKNNYVKGVLLVNKNYNLPSNYNPGTNKEALQAFYNMKNEASQNGISLWIVSGFRSYETQKSIYNRNVGLYGEQVANTFSAKPGQSEHQTGLAFDINSTKWAFENTKEAKWLAEHCQEYGFIIRYPKGKEDITGYVYEPWHIRYVGEELAVKIKDSGLCLEEYLGVN